MFTKFNFNFKWLLQTAFTRKKDFGKESREVKWVQAQRTLHGLHPTDDDEAADRGPWFQDMNDIAEQAKRRAEIARYQLVRSSPASSLNITLLPKIHIRSLASHGILDK